MNYKRNVTLLNNQPVLLKIARSLNKENKADLLALVHLAYMAESSVKRSLGIDVQGSEPFSLKTQDDSCKKHSLRRKK